MTYAEKITDTHIYFWGGVFSQWYPSMFMIDDVVYNCAEQYMMAEKARMFGDTDKLERIMKATHPAEQKHLGRQVQSFDERVWQQLCQLIVYRGNFAKFSQDNNLFDILLLETGDRVIVEGSSYDKIWGVGLAWNDPLIEDKKNWQGTNWLGDAIMRVRSDLRTFYRVGVMPTFDMSE